MNCFEELIFKFIKLSKKDIIFLFKKIALKTIKIKNEKTDAKYKLVSLKRNNIDNILNMINTKISITLSQIIVGIVIDFSESK